MMWTGECTDHSAIPGHNLLMTAKLLSWILVCPFRWAIEHFKTWAAHEVQPLLIRKPKFLLGTPFVDNTLYQGYLHFHTDYHTKYFSVYKSQAITESITNQNTWVGATQMGSDSTNAATKKSSGKRKEKQCFRAEIPSVPC